MLRRRTAMTLGAMVALVAMTPGSARGSAAGPAPPTRAAAIVTSSIHNDVSPPMRSIPSQSQLQAGAAQSPQPLRLLPRRASPSQRTAAVQASQGAVLAPSASSTFDGVGQGFVGPGGTYTVTSAPPDTEGSVGATQYVQMVNTAYAVFDKATGAVLLGPRDNKQLWAGFGGLCQTDNDGDPVVVYDKAAGRWVMSQFAVTGADGTTTPFLECVAVSTTSDATGTFNRYAFPFTAFPDYPKLGVWPDAYYMAFNMFDSTGKVFQGPQVCALDRIKMLAGTPATKQCFQLSTAFGGLLPSDVDGTRPPPKGSPDFFVDLGPSASLDFWRFHVDWTTPANTILRGPGSIATSAFTLPCGGTGGTCVPQSGTSQQLDTLGDRLMFRLAYRNFGDHESLVVNHSVDVGGPTAVRWYEIRDPNGTPVVFQQGTFAPDSDYRWMGSIAMDRAGDMALGYSASSSSIHPQVRYTGRTPSDPVGTMEAEVHLLNGTGSQKPTLPRWGDYSSMSVDPIDDCTFWYTNEYIPANGTFNWHTAIGSLRFPGCTPPVTWTSSGTAVEAVAASITVSGSNAHSVLVTAGADVLCRNTGQCSPADAVTIATLIDQDGVGAPGALTFSSVLDQEPSEVTIPNSVIVTGVAPGLHTYTLWVRASWPAGTPNPVLEAANIAVRDLD